MIVRFGGRGEWELDDALFELRRTGSPVAVQPKVLALLIHLTQHRDRTVSKAELFQALWPGERVGEGSLTRAVRGARLAVGDSGDGQSIIRSVRGIGYRFAASVDADGASDAPVPPDSGVPLIGRSDALAKLEQRLQRALGGEGSFACIVGPPGIGKSRLADAIALGDIWSGRDTEEVRVLYSAAGSLVDFILERWGRAELRRWVVQVSDSDLGREAIADVTKRRFGIGWSAFEADWKAYVEQLP